MLRNPISGALSNALRPPFGASGIDRAQVIAALYGNDEQGAMYDPSDLSTLFQDDAGTTPVTADGQPVGLMLDLSGNGNHATQDTAASRPLYRTDGTLHWLEFDGVDDFMECTLAGMDAQTHMAGTAVRRAAASSAAGDYWGNRIANNGRICRLRSTNDMLYAHVANPDADIIDSISDATAFNVFYAGSSESTSFNAANGGALNESGAAGYDETDSPTYRFGRGQSGDVLGGDIAAHATRLTPLTPESRALLEKWLASKSGVTLP